MTRIGFQEAQTQFAELMELASRGEVIVITRDGRTVAEVRPPTEAGQFEPSADASRQMTPQEAVETLRAIRARAKPGPPSFREILAESRPR